MNQYTENVSLESTTLSHVDSAGKANMVDVSNKADTARLAIAEGFIAMTTQAYDLVQSNQIKKGDVFSVARIAGIQATKQCANLIPLCHPLMLSKVSIDFELPKEDDINTTKQIRILCTCKLNGNTGVEMEALTGVSVAALTLFDMCKAVDPTMTIHSIRVLQKQGGKSGDWER